MAEKREFDASPEPQMPISGSRSPRSPRTPRQRQAKALAEVLIPSSIPLTVTPTEVLIGSLPYAAGFFALRVAVSPLVRKLVVASQPSSSSNPASVELRVLRASMMACSTVNALIGAVYSYTQQPKLERWEAWERQTGQSVQLHRPDVAPEVEAILVSSKRMVHLILGYLLNDLVAVAPDPRRYWAEIAHHIVGWLIGLRLLKDPREMLRFVPGVTRLELSTVPLNVLWALREFPQLHVPALLHATLRPLFLATFTYLRVLWFPAFFCQIYTQKPEVWRYVIGRRGQVLAALQYALHLYWFVLLCGRVAKSGLR